MVFIIKDKQSFENSKIILNQSVIYPIYYTTEEEEYYSYGRYK